MVSGRKLFFLYYLYSHDPQLYANLQCILALN